MTNEIRQEESGLQETPPMAEEFSMSENILIEIVMKCGNRVKSCFDDGYEKNDGDPCSGSFYGVRTQRTYEFAGKTYLVQFEVSGESYSNEGVFFSEHFRLGARITFTPVGIKRVEIPNVQNA